MEVTGTPESAYISNDTPMLSYLNVHAALEQHREAATAAAAGNPPAPAAAAAAAAAGRNPQAGNGPRVIICGPPDVGKSTLARLLVNYAARAGRRPMCKRCQNAGQKEKEEKSIPPPPLPLTLPACAPSGFFHIRWQSSAPSPLCSGSMAPHLCRGKFGDCFPHASHSSRNIDAAAPVY